MNEQSDDQARDNGEGTPDATAPPEPTPLDTPTAARPAASGEQSPGGGFNPLTNEADMFKVLVGVVIFAAIAISIVLIGRAAL